MVVAMRPQQRRRRDGQGRNRTLLIEYRCRVLANVSDKINLAVRLLTLLSLSAAAPA